MKKILVADEDAAARRMLARVLESSGYTAIQANGIQEAMLKFRSTLPVLVIMDLRTPDHDGWKAFDDLRHLDRTIPLIAITGWPHQHDSAIKKGIDALLEKPLDLTVLLQTIQDLTEATEPAAKPAANGKIHLEPASDQLGRISSSSALA
ncbi:MAG TPA: response regulator [Candidatus Limnocylindrales bacterium]|jgi:CheY-like chemotaxis protein|nr:response regulator [Candidatus Limnocylindrales bacterium]